MNVLVTGANGQLGREMRLVSKTSSDNYIFTDVREHPDVKTEILDITDSEAVRTMVKERNIKLVINCAAYTDVEKAEGDVELCALLNAKAPENLACAMEEQGGFLVHISTDYVFSGDSDDLPYTEDREVNPTSVYGKTKLDGEKSIIESGCRYIIIRTSWLYSEYGRNFVKTMVELTSSKRGLNVVSDQIGTPTYALDLAEVIYGIVENRGYEGNDGVYHYSNEGACSWYDFALTIARLADHTECDIQPCHSDEFPSKVRRPAYSVLDKTKIKKTFGIKIPYWIDSLKKCLSNLNK